MYSPLISVIIPVYNAENYLRSCLNSIVNQTYQNLEILCVNDGSTDNSAKILEEYAAKDSRVIIITQQNAGQSVARNVALERAKGYWITGIDADDYLDLDTYSLCINKISQTKGDCKMVIFGYGIEEAKTGKSVRKEPLPAEGLVKPTTEILYNTRCYFWNKLWRSDILKSSEVRFPIGMWFEDVAVFYQIAPYLDNILYIPEIKYHYLRHEGTYSCIDLAMAHHPKNIDRIIAADLILKKHLTKPFPESLRNLGVRVFEISYELMILHIYPEIQQQAWDETRRIIDENNLLENIYDNPKLALYYYLPPCTVAGIRKLYTNKWELYQRTRKIHLISNYSFLLKQYRLAQIKSIFSWGKRHTKYTEKKIKLKSLLREARAARKESRNQLFR